MLGNVSTYGMMGRLQWQRDKRGAMMEMEYVLTADDYVAFHRHHHASQGRLRLNRRCDGREQQGYGHSKPQCHRESFPAI